MSYSKVLRTIVSYLGIVAVACVAYRMPLLLSMTNHGEISTIKMLCIVIGVVSLFVGSLRFLLKSQAGGIPFLLAALAFMPVYRLTEWFLLAVVASCAGMIVGWLPGTRQR